MTAYRKVAKDCFIKWFGMDEKEAELITKKERIDELENGNDSHYGVGAKNSITAAVISISKEASLTKEETEEFLFAIIEGPNDALILNKVSSRLNNKNVINLALNALSSIHDKWVIDNATEKRFNQKKEKGQLRQYAPLELIGWNEVESDLIFLNPILEALSIKLDINELREAYIDRSNNYFINNNINTEEDIEKLIANNSAYYPIIPYDFATKLYKESKTIANQIMTNLDNKKLRIK